MVQRSLLTYFRRSPPGRGGPSVRRSKSRGVRVLVPRRGSLCHRRTTTTRAFSVPIHSMDRSPKRTNGSSSLLSSRSVESLPPVGEGKEGYKPSFRNLRMAHKKRKLSELSVRRPDRRDRRVAHVTVFLADHRDLLGLCVRFCRPGVSSRHEDFLCGSGVVTHTILRPVDPVFLFRGVSVSPFVSFYNRHTSLWLSIKSLPGSPSLSHFFNLLNPRFFFPM